MVMIISPKKSIKISIDKEVLKEFEDNAVYFAGPKYGSRGISIEHAMRIMNNYFRMYRDKRLIDIANETNLAPWEVGKILIDNYMMIHNELGLGIDFITSKEHCLIVKDYLEMKKEKFNP